MGPDSLNTMVVRRLGVIGTGLIGASVGLAAKRAGVEQVAGYDFAETAAETAKARGAIDEVCSTTEEVFDVDLLVVAVPVLALRTVLSDVVEGDWGCAVTDVGSTKASLCAAISYSIIEASPAAGFDGNWR